MKTFVGSSAAHHPVSVFLHKTDQTASLVSRYSLEGKDDCVEWAWFIHGVLILFSGAPSVASLE
jgi:hypothetical protein